MRKTYIFICLLLVYSISSLYAVTSDENREGSKVSLFNERVKSKGEFKGLVILVEFEDTPFTIPNPVQRFEEMLNSENYSYQGAHGSVKEYFMTNSDNAFVPSFRVVGPVKLPKKMSYYGENGKN